MQINTFRKELTAALASRKAERPPALRRSRRKEWIYATDIPMLIPGEEMGSLLEELAGAGWEYAETDGWLFLRKPAAEPPEDWYAGPFGPEAACCSSLLKRHPDLSPGTGTEAAQRTLIKAGEEGTRAYEDACSGLHREWAERLRQKKPLPALSLKYFGG